MLLRRGVGVAEREIQTLKSKHSRILEDLEADWGPDGTCFAFSTSGSCDGCSGLWFPFRERCFDGTVNHQLYSFCPFDEVQRFAYHHIPYAAHVVDPGEAGHQITREIQIVQWKGHAIHGR